MTPKPPAKFKVGDHLVITQSQRPGGVPNPGYPEGASGVVRSVQYWKNNIPLDEKYLYTLDFDEGSEITAPGFEWRYSIYGEENLPSETPTTKWWERKEI